MNESTGGRISPTKNFIAGGFGGMCLVFAGHPFDTIKIRLQTMGKLSSPKSSSSIVYKGALDCFKKTFVNEGIRGFYKGMGTPLLMTIPSFAGGFFFYGLGKTFVSKFPHTNVDSGSRLLSPMQLFCAGGISGSMTSFIVTPVELVKCLLQTQVQQQSTNSEKSSFKTTNYKGPLHCITSLLKMKGGILNLYKGFGVTFTRGVTQSALYFMTYDLIKRSWKNNEENRLTTGKTLLAGGLTGVIVWVITLPLDVLKSLIQTGPEGLYPRGVRDALPQLLRTEGFKGVYKGFFPVVIMAFTANAACFMGFEIAIEFLNWANVP